MARLNPTVQRFLHLHKQTRQNRWRKPCTDKQLKIVVYNHSGYFDSDWLQDFEKAYPTDLILECNFNAVFLFVIHNNGFYILNS